MRKWMGAGLGFLFTMGCVSVTKDYMPPAGEVLPPAFKISSEKDREKLDYFYMKLAEKNTERNSQWWIKYRRAQLWVEENPVLSCEKFSELAKDPLFPLNSLAWVRAHEVCSKESVDAAHLGEVEISKIDPWVKPTAVDVLLHRAEREEDKAHILTYSFEKSKFLLPMEEKVELTRQALDMAGKLGDKKKQAFFTKRLYSLAPRLDPHPLPQEWLKVAKDFRQAREFESARSFYRKVLNRRRSRFPDKLLALIGIRYAWKNERKKDEYVDATEKMARFVFRAYKKNKKNAYLKEKLHDAYVELMRTYWTEGQVKEAASVLDFLEKELKGRYSLGEVYWLRGRMEEEKQNYAEAVTYFTRGVKEKKINAELTEKLLWYQAWNLRKVKKFEDAKQALEALKDSTDNDFAKARYHYWLARSLEDLDQQGDAENEYRDLIETDPLGYYGLLAHRQIHELIPAGASPLLKQDLDGSTSAFSPNFEKSSGIKSIIQVPIIEWLLSVEEFDLAKNYLDDVSKSYNRGKDQDEETWLALFNYYARAGYYLGLYERLGQMSAERRNKILENHPELLFPRPYYEDVRLAADRFTIQKELIYSIMRQESAFNPRARSHADAFGLMQMLPEVARKKAKDLDVEFAKAEDLFDPYTNIQLGSAYVKELWERHSGQFILTVSSYNASEEAIRGWMQTRFTGDPVEFIEDIPYEETRGYVRLVMRNFIFYKVMESKGQRIPFPEELLHLNPVQATTGKTSEKAS
jgi:soluble lytic murein transglycosylase